jgi:hypothetical protein
MDAPSPKLSRKQYRAIAALLAEPTITKAAAKADTSAATIRRWAKLPEFKAAWEAAGRALVKRSLGRLQRGTGMAVQTLIKNLKADKASDQIRSALGILEHAMHGMDLMAMSAKVEELQAALAVLTEQANRESTDVESDE